MKEANEQAAAHAANLLRSNKKFILACLEKAEQEGLSDASDTEEEEWTCLKFNSQFKLREFKS